VGPDTFLLGLALAVASLLLLAVALVRIVRSTAEVEISKSVEARQVRRRWAIIAAASITVFLCAAGLAIASYLGCVGEC